MTTADLTPPPPAANPERRGELLRAFARSELGRDTLRRQIVEGAHAQAGQQALVLYDLNPAPGTEEVVRVVADLLRERGLHVSLMQVDQMIPVQAGTDTGAWAHLEKYKLPAAVWGAIRAADVIFDYGTNSRGGQKYNLDFYTLGMYDAKRISAHRPLEAMEVLGTDPENPIAQPDAMTYPSDLLRVISERVNEVLFRSAAAGQEWRLTNPWGTDLRFTTLPGDVVPTGGIREYPADPPFHFAGDDNNRLYLGLAGCTTTQCCDGVWVARHSSLLGGLLPYPIRVTFTDGFVTGADGGPEADRLMGLLQDEASGIHAVLVGLNPKVAPFRDGRYMLVNNGAGAGVAHLGIGGPGLFYRAGAWGGLGNKHFQLGNLPKVSLWAGDTCIFKDGALQVLDDPRVRAAAEQYGDPDDLLRQFDWPEEV